MSEERIDNRADALQEAIAKTIQEYGEEGPDKGGIVTKYVLCLETIGTDGEPYHSTYSHRRSTMWDRLGLLQFAVAGQQAIVSTWFLED